MEELARVRSSYNFLNFGVKQQERRIIMALFQQTRSALFLALDGDLINENEFLILYNLHTSIEIQISHD